MPLTELRLRALRAKPMPGKHGDRHGLLLGGGLLRHDGAPVALNGCPLFDHRRSEVYESQIKSEGFEYGKCANPWSLR